MVFKADNSFEGYVNRKPFVTGNYVLTDSIFSFIDNGCNGIKGVLDDSNAVSIAVKRGFAIFNEKGKCIKCHFGSDFTANEFRNIGLFNGKNLNNSGRIVITKVKDDIGRFKTPTLRNAGVTAPYMHNGRFKTLREVIDFYNEPDKVVGNSVNRDSNLIQPLGLTLQEKGDLEAFLISFTSKQFITKGIHE